MNPTALTPLSGRLVRLRPMQLDDLDRYFAWINDPEVTQYLEAAWLPPSRAEEEQWLQRAIRQTSPPEISLAIETLEEGRHIGSVALHGVRPPHTKATLGIIIGDKAYWSRGYGTDAVLTMLRFAVNELNLHRVELQVHEDNARAIACYRKCGFLEEGRLRDDRLRRGEYRDTLVMGVLADEFRSLHPREKA